MTRRNWIITAVILLLLFGMAAWRARHRIQAVLDADAEQKKQQGLHVVVDTSARRPDPPAPSVTAMDWPWWRGFQQNNHAATPSPPLIWSETENILWKVPVSGRGHSSPCVVGNRIYLTTALEDEGTRFILCLNADTGTVLWQQRVHQGQPIYHNPKNTQAASTVATDGQNIFCLFAVDNAVWLSCFSLEGNQLWQLEVGPYSSKEGFGASPLIMEDAVIVAADNVNHSWITSVHRMTGEILWRTARGPGTSYASPAVISYAGEPLIVMAGLNKTVAINPASGAEVWTLPGPDLSASTPTAGDGMLFVTGCTQDSGVFGIRLSDPPQIMWQQPIKAEVPSPLYADGLVYIAQDLGIMQCLEADSGIQVWRQRLGSNVTASPVLSGDHLLVSLEDGRTIILKTGRSFLRVRENKLDDALYATPAISRGRIFIRGSEHLYAIGEPSPSLQRTPGLSNEESQ